MKKEQFNQDMNRIHVPVEKLVILEKEAINRGKKNKNLKRAKRYSILTACGLCLSLFGSGFIFTGVAQALSNIPLIGPIYKSFNDIASDKVESEQLMTSIDKQDSQNGLTMTVKDAAYDGNRFMVSIVYSGASALSMEEQTIGLTEVFINDKPIDAVISSTHSNDINSKTIIEHHQLTFSNFDEYADQIEVSVKAKDVFGHNGKWKVSFPLEKVIGDVSIFYPKVKTDLYDNKYRLTADKIIFSPLSTRVDLTVDYPVDMDLDDSYPWFGFSVVDDQGKRYDKIKIQTGQGGDFGHHMVLTLPPMNKTPKFLILKPSSQNSEGFSQEIKGLELMVPIENK